MTAGIYKITCMKNCMEYYGQSCNAEKRFIHHKHRLLQGNHYSDSMQSDFNKYGEKSFEFLIIENLDSAKDRRMAELSFIKASKAMGMSYNANGVSESGKHRYITVLLTEDLYQAIKRDAKAKKRTLASTVRDLIHLALNMGAK